MKKYTNKSYRTMLRAFCWTLVLWIMPGCTDKFDEYNTNKTQLMELSDTDLGGLFSKSLGSQFENINYSRGKGTISDHLSGYFTSTFTIYEQNTINTGWITRIWATYYTNALPALVAILDLTKEKNSVAYSVAMIWKCYIMQRVTDYWGPVPYTDAASGKAVTQFESQKDIYYNMFKDLASAVQILEVKLQKEPNLNVFGAADMMYNGDVSKWIRFANTLRLRMAIRISNVDPDKAKQEAEAAVAGDLIESNDDNAMLKTTQITSGGNGLSNMWAYFQNIMSASMESLLKGYDDPRVGIYFNKVDAANIAPSFPDQVKGNAGGYHGMSNGFESVYAAFLKAHSLVGDRWKDDNWNITPIDYIHAADTCFLKAEGAWRGWNMGGSAQQFYEKGIELSLKQWRSDLSDGSIRNYINSTLTPVAPDNYPYYDPPMTDIPVKFSGDREKQYEQIITQKWISVYPESIEAWAEYRRTRLPKLYAKKYSGNGNILLSKNMIVTRVPYPDSEKNSQPEEVAKAVEMLGGPDLESTPLWWDVNQNGN